jgi:hypothetical protein
VAGLDQMVVGKYRKIVTLPLRSAVGRSKERDNLCAKIKRNATCSVARAFYTESRPFTPNTELTVAPWDTPHNGPPGAPTSRARLRSLAG